MATYSRSSQPNEELAHNDSVWNEFGKVETALEAHSDYMYLTVYVGSLGNSVANTTIQGAVLIPEACTLVSVQMACSTTTGTSDPTVDIFEEDAGTPASILDAPVSLAAADTVYSGTIGSGDETRTIERLGVRCTTAADGTATAIAVTFTLKKTLTS